MSLKLERDLNPTSRSQFSRAKLAAQSKNSDYAISLIQAVLKTEPLFLEGRRYLRVIEIQKYNALSTFAKGLLMTNIGSVAMKLSGIAKKEPAEQMAVAEEVLEVDPFNVKANTVIADAGNTLGYPDFEAFAYETLAEGKPNDKVTLNTLAAAYMKMKVYEKAINTYLRILEIDRGDGDALSGLKNAEAAHASKKDWEKGDNEPEGEKWRKALKSKKEAEDLEQSAKVVKSTEAIDEQIQINYQKHQAEPTNPAYSKAIAKLFVQKNDYANAIPFYQHAFEVENKIDTSLEKIIGDLKLKKAEQELQKLRAALATQTDPDQQAQYQAEIDQKEKELNEVRLEQAESRVKAQPN